MALLRRKVLPPVLTALALCMGIGLYFLFCNDTASAIGQVVDENPAYYATSQSGFSVKEALAAYQSGAFKPIATKVLNAGIARDYYWVHFTVSNKAGNDSTMLLDIDNARLNEMVLWQLAGDTALSLGTLGDFMPFNRRVIKDKSFLFELQSPAGSKINYLLFVNQVGSTFTLPLKLKSVEAWSASRYRQLFLEGIVYGILVFVATLSLLFYFASAYRVYLYYAAYIISGVGWLFAYFGLGYAYLWGNWPPVNTAAAPMMASINILFNLQICQALLGLPVGNKLLNRLFNGFKTWLLLLACFPLINLNDYSYTVNHHYLVVLLLSILAAMLLMSITVIQDAFKKSATARVYLLASLCKGVSIAMLALLELGLLPAMAGMEGWMQLGILFEIGLLTYALARRYAGYKLKTFARVIEAHEKERSMISREIHDSISNSLTGMHYAVDDVLNEEKEISDNGRTTLQKLSNDLSRLHTEARNISHNVMPGYVDERSLTEIIEKYLEEFKGSKNFGQAAPVAVSFSANKEEVLFTREVKLNIFRILQEILTNIVKHAQASQAEIVVDFLKHKMLITVEDNGVGLLNNPKAKKGMGLRNIKSRVELLQGELSIGLHLSRTPGGTTVAEPYGTRLQIKIPYERQANQNLQEHAY